MGFFVVVVFLELGLIDVFGFLVGFEVFSGFFVMRFVKVGLNFFVNFLILFLFWLLSFLGSVVCFVVVVGLVFGENFEVVDEEIFGLGEK